MIVTCILRVISAARIENTWPVNSANFENGMETGLNYNEDRKQSPMADLLYKVIFFCKVYTFQPSNTLKKTAVIIRCCYSNHSTNY